MLDQAVAIKAAAEALGQAEAADVLFFNGDITRQCDYPFIVQVTRRKRRERVVLLLVTPGGDADAAYRMGRILQSAYKEVTVFIPGWCKSAGTLLAISAHRIVMSVCGELGPLDVQLGKRDELWEFGSGLDFDSAMQQLKLQSVGMFEEMMMQIERASLGRITFKTASQLSYEMVTKLFGNLYSQIDPIEIGKTARLMTVAKDYGERLAKKAQNFKRDDALDVLVTCYSSHSFVIDYEEACGIFNHVERASPEFQKLELALGGRALYPVESSQARKYHCSYLNEERPNVPETAAPHPGDEQANRERPLPDGADGLQAGDDRRDTGPTNGAAPAAADGEAAASVASE